MTRSSVASRAIPSSPARARRIGLALVLCAAASRDARADDASDETRACAVAYEGTQRQRQRSELLAALDSAERCARSSCPALLRDECVAWRSEIRPRLPSLVVRVRGADGCARTDARLAVDGPSRKDGSADALLVDPGRHEVSVTDPVSGSVKTQTIDFAPGERRDIDVDFASDDAVCDAPVSVRTPVGPIPSLTLVIGSVGAGLVVAGATVGLIGAAERAELDACKPGCSQEQIDDVRPFFLAGDVLAGFGLLALGAAVVTYFALDTKPSAATSGRLVLGATGLGASF